MQKIFGFKKNIVDISMDKFERYLQALNNGQNLTGHK